MDCYHCGQEGHRRNECPARWPAPAASQPSASAQNIPMRPIPHRTDPTPPTLEYLEARAQIGKARGPMSEYLAVKCPWCDAPEQRPCVNRALGRDRLPHDARAEAAGLPPADDREMRAVARKQMAETRALRHVI